MSSLVRQQIEDLLKFLQPLLNLANCHMVDFFTRSAYTNFLPVPIQTEIEEIGKENAINLIFKNDFSSAPHIRNFVETSSEFTLKNCNICLTIDDFMDKLQAWGCDNIDKFKLEIFMSAKKSHEVEILSAVAASVSKLSNTSHVIDIGDGKGYLSSMLALHNHISVLGVDASNSNTCGAIKRVNKLSRVWNGIPTAPHKSQPKKGDDKSSSNVNLYKQVTQFVDEDFDLQKLVVDTFQTNSLQLRLGLVGLHTCGNLAPNSMKIFRKNDCVKSIINVGCCYHLLEERFEEAMDSNKREFGFPLSKFLNESKLVIGRSARMIANQSVDRILNTKELPNITIFYRALLQVLLEAHCMKLPTKHVGKFRKSPLNFTEYTRIAMKRIDADADITDQQIEELFANYKERLNELNLFYLLRCKLAPVIESLILLDRLLFLHEEGFEKSFLVQLFDPVVSPRCYGIVALKEFSK